MVETRKLDWSFVYCRKCLQYSILPQLIRGYIQVNFDRAYYTYLVEILVCGTKVVVTWCFVSHQRWRRPSLIRGEFNEMVVVYNTRMVDLCVAVDAITCWRHRGVCHDWREYLLEDGHFTREGNRKRVNSVCGVKRELHWRRRIYDLSTLSRFSDYDCNLTQMYCHLQRTARVCNSQTLTAIRQTVTRALWRHGVSSSEALGPKLRPVMSDHS